MCAIYSVHKSLIHVTVLFYLLNDNIEQAINKRDNSCFFVEVTGHISVLQRFQKNCNIQLDFLQLCRIFDLLAGFEQDLHVFIVPLGFSGALDNPVLLLNELFDVTFSFTA